MLESRLDDAFPGSNNAQDGSKAYVASPRARPGSPRRAYPESRSHVASYSLNAGHEGSLEMMGERRGCRVLRRGDLLGPYHIMGHIAGARFPSLPHYTPVITKMLPGDGRAPTRETNLRMTLLFSSLFSPPQTVATRPCTPQRPPTRPRPPWRSKFNPSRLPPTSSPPPEAPNLPPPSTPPHLPTRRPAPHGRPSPPPRRPRAPGRPPRLHHPPVCSHSHAAPARNPRGKT